MRLLIKLYYGYIWFKPVKTFVYIVKSVGYIVTES